MEVMRSICYLAGFGSTNSHKKLINKKNRNSDCSRNNMTVLNSWQPIRHFFDQLKNSNIVILINTLFYLSKHDFSGFINVNPGGYNFVRKFRKWICRHP